MKLALLCAASLLVLTACGAAPSESALPETTPVQTAAPSPDPTEEPGATPAPTAEPSPVPEEIMYQRYIDTFTAPDLAVDTTVTANGCTLTLEDSLDTEPELLVYQGEVYQVEGDLDSLDALLGENLSYVGLAETTAAEFGRGQGGMDSITIHELHSMTPEEVKGASDYTRRELQQFLADYDLQQWTMVAVDLSWTYTAEQEAAGPQLPAGEYQRYYLLGMPSGADDWKLYNVYWEDFYPQQ